MLYHDITLDPFQEESINAINQNHSLLVAAPTGAGKTLIAEYAIEKCLDEGRRAVYTAPIKALSNQKFRDFTARYGDRIGIKTGDVTINPDADVILMTTEIFRNTIFESPHMLEDISYAVFDEIHYLDDIERGTVWEESIIFAPPHIRFVCLSATIPNLDQIARWIRNVRPQVPLKVVVEMERPVPLNHKIYVPSLGLRNTTELKGMEKQGRIAQYYNRKEEDAWRQKLIDLLHKQNRLPAIYFAFNRRECEEHASALRGSLLTDDERKEILNLFDQLCARFAIEPDANVNHLRSLVGKGTAFHHAGLLPTLKEVLERIFTSGLLKLLFATETFAVGVNMPARTVVFNTMYKFDGRRLAYLPTRSHHQMSGRAGRRGIDKVGYVYSVAEWPHIRTRWIEKIIWGEIEPIRSQFNLSYATILTLYERLGEKIYQACEKSFANFQYKKKKAKLKKTSKALRDQMKRKIMLLRSLGYLHGEKLTKKGKFAKTIYGYELQVAELYFNGTLHRMDENQLNILFSAVTYESKKRAWYRKLDRGMFKSVKQGAKQAIDDIQYTEDSLEIEDRTKELDYKLSSAVLAWSRGCTWRDLEAHTSASDGDIVRFLRISIQLLRNTMYACPKDDPLRDKLHGAVQRMCRDVVDAERQLRMGAGLPIPDEEAEAEAEDDDDASAESA